MLAGAVCPESALSFMSFKMLEQNKMLAPLCWLIAHVSGQVHIMGHQTMC